MPAPQESMKCEVDSNVGRLKIDTIVVWGGGTCVAVRSIKSCPTHGVLIVSVEKIYLLLKFE